MPFHLILYIKGDVKMFEKIRSFISLAIMFAMITITASLFFQKFVLHQPPQLFGYSWAIVVSGSMEPNIMTNDVIILKKSDTYEVGDVIAFQVDNPAYGGVPVTHRIVEITEKDGKLIYTTKGDANPVRDEDIIFYENILGRVIKIIPELNPLISKIRH